MPSVSFVGLLIVALVAFLAPLLIGLSPAHRLPWVVVEIVAGIVIGPSVLGWVSIDLPISMLSHRPGLPVLSSGDGGQT
jgi:Kef-type K+ transport system membrane component KefB